MEKEPWYLLTNIESLDEVLKIYRSIMGIEAMFKDCKTGGYNLEGSKANVQGLTNLILLTKSLILLHVLEVNLSKNMVIITLKSFENI
ncbi:MAG: hypothetical protein O4859_26195 [Trichodesmium sp. St18_bin1]|nr:hypothetical protein [Trichodesmium sp. St18_bin1]MDE5122572.1 hypothetical protein [Trichodesmium sp. St19_bin1]